MERVVKRALSCLALVACVHAATERPRATVNAEMAAATPAQRRIDLPITFLRAGKEPSAAHAEGTLIVVRYEMTGEHERYWLEELDVSTMRAFRSKDLGATSLVDLKVAGSLVYLLTTDLDAGAHAVTSFDANGFAAVATSRVAGAVPDRFTDHAVTTGLTIGTRGVLVSFRAACPRGTAESEDGCIFYETHRLGDLAVVKVRHYAFDRMSDLSKPQVHVPDDWGEPPEKPAEPPPDAATCPFHGTIMLGAARVGDHQFMLTSGCCGGPRGGLFECDAPK